MSYLSQINVDLLNGLFRGTVDFNPDFNIISGENGTFKTKLLQQIKTNPNLGVVGPSPAIVDGQPQQPLQLRIQAISPKRNSERRAYEQVEQFYRSQNRNRENVFNEAVGWQVNDQSFSNYPALGDLFHVVYEDYCRDGTSRVAHMDQTVKEFNEVIVRIFQKYRLCAEWNTVTGMPKIHIEKNGNTRVDINHLSLGEQEILSLVLNLFNTRDRFDLFLIDEPEVHLNWHLEEKLFDFFQYFCNEWQRQIIIVTHSRAIFKPDFLKKTHFLQWADEKIIVTKTITELQREKLAGEAINIIKLGDFEIPTLFVEDAMARKVFSKLAETLSATIQISECGNCSNIVSLYNHSKNEGGWKNCLFVIDGDNQGSPYPGAKDFLRLKKYCTENYLLSVDRAAKALNISEDQIRTNLLESIRKKADKVFSKSKFFEFLLSNLKAVDLTQERIDSLDASEFMEDFVRQCGMDFDKYLEAYIGIDKNSFASVFPSELLTHISKGIAI